MGAEFLQHGVVFERLTSGQHAAAEVKDMGLCDIEVRNDGFLLVPVRPRRDGSQENKGFAVDHETFPKFLILENGIVIRSCYDPKKEVKP